MKRFNVRNLLLAASLLGISSVGMATTNVFTCKIQVKGAAESVVGSFDQSFDLGATGDCSTYSKTDEMILTLDKGAVSGTVDGSYGTMDGLKVVREYYYASYLGACVDRVAIQALSDGMWGYWMYAPTTFTLEAKGHNVNLKGLNLNGQNPSVNNLDGTLSITCSK